jgi:arylsulfatase
MFVYALSNQDGDLYPNQERYKTRIRASDSLAPGKHVIVFDFAYDGGGVGKGGTGTLTVDGQKVAEGRIEMTNYIRFSLDETFDVG